MGIRVAPPNKYTDPRLAEATDAQWKTLNKFKGKYIGLCISGVMKAATKNQVLLIDRRGVITMKTKRIAKW